MSESDARLFAHLVDQMLEPIKARLQEGDRRFGEFEAALRHLANETSKANAAMNKMPELKARLARIESLCPRCGETLVSGNEIA
jgi:hypothetical protein